MSANSIVVSLYGDRLDCETFAEAMADFLHGERVIVALPHIRPYMGMYDHEQLSFVIWATYVDQVMTCETVSHCLTIAVLPDKEPFASIILGVSDMVLWVSGGEPPFPHIDARENPRAGAALAKELIDNAV